MAQFTDEQKSTVSADEIRLLDSLQILLLAAERQSEPGIQAGGRLNHLEVTLRFSNKNVSVQTLKMMAAVAAERAL
jgi:hypothetical protein